MFSLEKGPQLQRSRLSWRAENVRSHGLCHWQGKPGLNLFRESIQGPREAQQHLKPRSTGERSSELEHGGLAVRTGQETKAQQEKLLEATSVPGVPGMPVTPKTIGPVTEVWLAYSPVFPCPVPWPVLRLRHQR